MRTSSRRHPCRSIWRHSTGAVRRTAPSPARSWRRRTPTRRAGGPPRSAPATATAMPAAVARILSVLTLGRMVDGVRLLSERTAELILAEQTAGTDLVNGLYLRWGLGFALSDPRTLPWVPAGRIGYWGGWGGSMAIVDLDRRMTISYVMNRVGGGILGSDRAEEYVIAAYRAVATICVPDSQSACRADPFRQ
ncbi:serine hydrolase [Micromonospora pisi]|uniref:serine hydrolase n=1 Tax=Micromonospora pisi TaxID=589240 RepID=UPI0014768F0A|nr:serine hydrolase [Micromonospora pisi]